MLREFFRNALTLAVLKQAYATTPRLASPALGEGASRNRLPPYYQG